MTARVKLQQKEKKKKKETQGVWCQDELLGSKPPVIK
jgi:hypothetical protein